MSEKRLEAFLVLSHLGLHCVLGKAADGSPGDHLLDVFLGDPGPDLSDLDLFPVPDGIQACLQASTLAACGRQGRHDEEISSLDSACPVQFDTVGALGAGCDYSQGVGKNILLGNLHLAGQAAAEVPENSRKLRAIKPGKRACGKGYGSGPLLHWQGLDLSCPCLCP